MNIAIIGTGNVGGALAAAWAQKGHRIRLGVRDTASYKGQNLLELPGVSAHPVREAVAASDVILISVPAMAAVETAASLGNTEGKIIMDAMNIVMGRGPAGFTNTAEAILSATATRDVVKCFNSTGFNNMENPVYGSARADMFMAGSSVRGKAAARQLALDAGFESCYDIGGNDRFTLLEQFAFFWINLAMMQGQGRDIAFKLLRR